MSILDVEHAKTIVGLLLERFSFCRFYVSLSHLLVKTSGKLG